VARFYVRGLTFAYTVPGEAVELICTDQHYRRAWLTEAERVFRDRLAESNAQPFTPWDWSAQPSPMAAVRPGAIVIRADCQARFIVT